MLKAIHLWLVACGIEGNCMASFEVQNEPQQTGARRLSAMRMAAV